MNNLDEYASSSRAVVKALEGLGFNGVELWKDPATKHYVFSGYHQPKSWTDPKDSVTFCSETICYYDLRASDWTIREWLEEFLNKAIESDWDKEWHGQSLELSPLLENLKNVIIV